MAEHVERNTWNCSRKAIRDRPFQRVQDTARLPSESRQLVAAYGKGVQDRGLFGNEVVVDGGSIDEEPDSPRGMMLRANNEEFAMIL
ncbi:MAG TPA: hypothetical protein VGH74_10690 [Planctomycetaceae bacterium]